MVKVSEGKHIAVVSLWMWNDWDRMDEKIDELIEEGYKPFSTEIILINLFIMVFLFRDPKTLKSNTDSPSSAESPPQ